MNPSKYSRIEHLLIESDLLNSEKKHLDYIAHNHFFNETILITGAAGSIGSELARQLIGSEFKNLILIDNSESPLSNLEKEFGDSEKSNINFVLIDVRDIQAMQWLFDTYRPTIVFHAAAYKHVPLMEDNAYEAVRLNILATKILADLSVSYSVKKFVFISTDKAVNPISVMGMTKRIAESYLNYLNETNKTIFLVTRFGNILGSSGSVLPILLKQINANRPLTITSKETSRFFIDKHKACNLILKIASFTKKDGYLFTFNMGDPIKIIDLAYVLLKFLNKENLYKDIKIIGLRPGEKLHEQIVSRDEILEPANFSNILSVKPKIAYSDETINFQELMRISSKMTNEDIRLILEECVYKLQHSPTLLFAI